MALAKPFIGALVVLALAAGACSGSTVEPVADQITAPTDDPLDDDSTTVAPTSTPGEIVPSESAVQILNFAEPLGDVAGQRVAAEETWQTRNTELPCGEELPLFAGYAEQVKTPLSANRTDLPVDALARIVMVFRTDEDASAFVTRSAAEPVGCTYERTQNPVGDQFITTVEVLAVESREVMGYPAAQWTTRSDVTLNGMPHASVQFTMLAVQVENVVVESVVSVQNEQLVPLAESLVRAAEDIY